MCITEPVRMLINDTSSKLNLPVIQVTTGDVVVEGDEVAIGPRNDWEQDGDC